MVSLNTEYQQHTVLFSANDSLPIVIDRAETNSMIKACLSIKKNVLFRLNIQETPKLNNLENLIINDDYIFIPSRLKKKFNGLENLKELA